MLNWLARYSFVSAELEFGEDGALCESVLDVGCGALGLSSAAPKAAFVGIDGTFPEPIAQRMVGFRNEPGPLPFQDGSFDTVICLDVLEHLPPHSHAGFVEELARVSARRVLLACPSVESVWIEDLIREAYGVRGIPIPAWLSEHDEHGLPSVEEIAGFCTSPSGFMARELTMTNGLLTGLAVVADVLPGLADHAGAEWREHREEWLELFKAGRFGSCYRKGYSIDRLVPKRALVDARRLAETVWSALLCPACRRPAMKLLAAGPRCDACGHHVARDASGAWDLAQTATPAAPAARRPPSLPAVPTARVASHSSSGTRLLLSPDWNRPAQWLPVVARYLRGTDPDRGTTLCVDGMSAELSLDPIQQMLTLACESISGGRPFANVLVLDAPYLADGLIRVSDARQVDECLDLPPRARPSSPHAIEAHARHAKALHDSIRAVVERARFEGAPDPWASREPLVSVRIPTWRGHELLVERAIPSVLNGSYRRVEVIVCSDGPDPEARAAVTGMADARVRYYELPERPAYAQQPWSFWETAGIHAANRALDECVGTFIAPLDHDDAFTDDHLTTLLAASFGCSADLAYGQALTQESNATWRICGSAPLAHGHIAHGSALYSARLGHMRMDADSWLLNEPGDWNMWRRMSAAGALAAFVPQVVLAHFRERGAIETHVAQRGPDLMIRRPEEIAADLAYTGLDWLLDIPVPAAASPDTDE
jgi:SAM-dependent methyltransferase